MTTTQIICLAIFGTYALGCTLACASVFVTAMAYRDLGKGLLRILERRKAENTLEDVDGLTEEIGKYYASYSRHNPSVHKRYAGIVNWLDDVLMQANLFDGKKHRWGSWFDGYYETLGQVQAILERRYPFYRCTSGQIQILQDISALAPGDSGVGSVVKKTEEEFISLNSANRKNDRNNAISIAIGVAGILVSVLLTVMQMFG